MIRPERLKIAETIENNNVLTGVVEGRVFLGPLSRIAVAIGEERLLVDALNMQTTSVEMGSTIHLTFTPEDGHVLE
ncbi:hypothetical protein SDC9_122956 [bioreactor metagenome]|uniref:Transport-associated OB type 2 domain-containing protein n=2 Tax=root TaxID=1 RepID=A0A645CGC6_9ZZZZ